MLPSTDAYPSGQEGESAAKTRFSLAQRDRESACCAGNFKKPQKTLKFSAELPKEYSDGVCHYNK
jgi:hypothetical protein